MITFKERNSFLHSLDPRVKLLWLAGFTVCILLSKTFPVALIATIANIFLFSISKISAREIWDDGRGVLIFSLIPIPLLALSYPGTAFLQIGFLTATYEGVVFGILSTISLVNVIATAMLFTYTTKPSRLVDALSWFHAPTAISFPLAIAFSFIPLFIREVKTVRIAQSARGARMNSPLSVFPMLLPVLHRAFRRAEKLTISLESRGFSPENEHKHNLKMRLRDYAATAAAFAFLALAFFARTYPTF